MRQFLVFPMFLLSASPVWAGTVAFYNFDGSPTHDASGNGRDATILGEVPPVVSNDGPHGEGAITLGMYNGLQFDYPFPFNSGNATLEFWVKVDDASKQNDIFWTNTICDSGACDSNRYNIEASGGTFYVDYRPIFDENLGGWSYSVIQPVLSTSQDTFASGVWTFVALVKDGNTFSVYFNGDQTPNQSFTVPANGSAYPTSSAWTLNGRVFVDYYGPPSQLQFEGQIADLRISDTALAPGDFLYSPEPGTWGLLFIGATALLPGRRRRR